MSASSREDLLPRVSLILHQGPPVRDELNRVRLGLWLATAFFTGAAIMAQEIVALRLFAPYFGYSIYVWGSMISVVMVALAVGYAAGGWVSDRSQTDLPLYGMVLASAGYQLGVLFTVRPMLRLLAHKGDFTGVALASLLIFAAPMAALATACPFLIRLLARSGRVGSVAGKIYAVSTFGGIAGILATSFFLVPRLGTQRTLEVICVLSALVGVAGLVRRVPFQLFALGLIVMMLRFAPGATWSQSTLWVAESPYNLVRVVRNGKWVILKLNDEGGVHTIRDERTGWTEHYYDDFALGPLLAPARNLLVLGMGGGGSIAATRVTAPNIDIDAVEIDPKVVEAATRFFGMNPQDQKLRVHIADARPWLARGGEKYDLVHVDLYQGGPYIPFYLVTVEFFEAVRAHMSPDGLLMMNLFDISPKRELLVSTVATLERVFPAVVVLSVGYGNRMLLAFTKQTATASIRARLSTFEGDEAVKRLARWAEAQVTEFEVPAGATVFTDDFAPVEEMTRRMLNSN
jgi:spermidine synthase